MEDDTSIALAHQLADLLRENARLQAEVHSLGGILRSAVLHREVPEGWSQILKQMRNTSEYRAIAEQYAQLITRLERSASARELGGALKGTPHSRRVN